LMPLFEYLNENVSGFVFVACDGEREVQEMEGAMGRGKELVAREAG
jgi:Ni,Fe-hydrogenase III component G